MKGIFLSPDVSKWEGIQKKVEKEVELFNESGIAMELLEDKATIKSKLQMRIPLFSKQLQNFNIFSVKNADFLYIRRPFIDLNFLYTVALYKRYGNKKIIVEIPTFPYDNEIPKDFINISLFIKDKIWRKFVKYYVDRYVTYSNDNEIFGVKTIRISNGVDYNTILSKKSSFNQNFLRFIAVASLSYWHGYDRLIKAIGEYYKTNPRFKVYFDIVGDYSEELGNQYRLLIASYEIEEYVNLVGKKTGEALSEAFNQADIAVDSLGRHRSGVYFNSSLKGKEYIGRGLPVVSGVETELDSYEDYPYYYRVSADENPIIIKKIVDFYLNTIVNSEKSSAQIISSIRNFGIDKFDMKIAFKPVIEYVLGEDSND